MMQIPQAIRNKIAQQPEIKNRSMKRLFEMTNEELEQQINSQAKELEQRGLPNKVILAYLELAPLLIENRAVQAFLRKVGDLSLMGVLPDLQTLDDLALLAVNEYHLTPNQVTKLNKLLMDTTNQ